MFNSARLKLTAWYLIVIMLVSVSFSLMIFQIQVAEWQRFERRFHFEVVSEAAERLTIFLVVINGGILITAGGLGYVLAGRTLKPIKEMVDDQNRFIGDASHELRTPLTAIKSALEVNLTDKKLLKDCLEQVDKLQSLTEGLLQLSKDNPKFESVKLAMVIEDAIKVVGPKAKPKNITIKSVGISSSVKGDKNSLTDLVTILLDNAVKYSPKKSTVTVETDKSGFSISDQGIGIEQKDLPHIFDRFYRADSARTKSDGGGYGLGLSIAKKIVDANHGSIKVESKLDSGTTFSVTFS